jgi:zinc/manganese transport system ATP-binding protein
MTSENLSQLYRTDVEVVRVRGRILVVGAEDSPVHHHDEHVPGREEVGAR